MVAGAAFASLLFSTPSYAIPSPDLVVGSISSISQLIALISALVGGGAVVAGARASAGSAGATRAARIAWRTVWVAGGVLAVSLVANYYQYSTYRAERQTRLEAAIQRPTPVSDGHTLDADLKEASYGEQLKSPRGISTDEMQHLLDATQHGLDRNDVLVDVRETAETHTGTFPNATPIRFPDFLRSPHQFAGKTVVLYCDNGNRSYETCQKLAALGIDCRFMIGGLQKWMAEHRPFAGVKYTSLADFRALPSYPNKDLLLDTPDVNKLVAKGAIFVDVRYPGEFAAYHLPGAIDLPVRPTPENELDRKIASLPHRPIIAPCYDTRSCFYARVLGYMLTKAGYDFAGRYTVPSEYVVPEPPRPYIKQYLEESRKSWWARLVDLVAAGLTKSANDIGFLSSIVLLAVISRLLVLPFSLKAERDQVVSKELAPEVEALKKRLKGDPRRLARSMRAFYRAHGLTPLRNMLGLAFLPLMSVCVASVHTVAAQSHQSLLWTADSGVHDPSYVLPIAFAALICVYLDSAFVRTLTHRVLVWTIGMVVLTATGRLLSAAADVYLVASAALLLIQRAWVTNKLGDVVRWLRRLRLPDGVVPLDDAERLAGCGNKAYRLGVIKSQGFPVPAGLVLTSEFLAKFSKLSPQLRAQALDRVWHALQGQKLVVRSSGSAEDGSANSFAGVFESVLNVDRERLEAAVTDVLASFSTAKTAAYGVGNGQANILVQRMIEPEYSGVLFTRDLKCPSHSLVEFVEGTADKLVSGTMTPVMCRFGRVSAERIGEGSCPLDLKPLVLIGQQLEKVFGGPQDVEWAYADGRFHIVQSRDITRLDHGSESETAIQNEWSRALDCAAGTPADEIAFEQNELSEVLPRPTILSLSLMDSLWSSGGSIDLACRKLGIGYRVDEDSAPYLLTIFGRLYVNKQQELARAPRIGSLAMWRLGRVHDKIKNDFTNEFLPEFLKEIAWQEAMDFDKLSDGDLLDAVARIRENYAVATSVTASVINIAADYYLRQAREKLVAAGLEPAHYLAHLDQTDFERAITMAKQSSPGDREAALLRAVGHRAAIDYELAEPRYCEKLSALDHLLEIPPLPVKTFAEISGEITRVSSDPKLREAVLLACSFQTLKEDAKHHSLREIAVLRRAILAVDRRFALDGLVFQLTFDEIESLRNEKGVAALRSLARSRKQHAEDVGHVSPAGSTLTVRQIEEGAIGIKSGGADASSGIRVSGTGTVEGRACVVLDDDTSTMDIIPNFKDGDIVVSRMVPPTWIPYFQKASGFVCEVGGWLSHTAIVAREFNVPLIVQAKGIRTIESGQMIRLHPDGAVEIVVTEPT